MRPEHNTYTQGVMRFIPTLKVKVEEDGGDRRLTELLLLGEAVVQGG